MPGIAVARRYAEAVFELGEEGNALEQWQDDLTVLAEVTADPQVLAVLENEKTPLEQRRALLDRALTGLSPLARNLARLLLVRGRLGLLPEIARIFTEMLDQRNGVVRAQVTTAIPLDAADQRAVAERLRTLTGARQVQIDARVDPAIIGGLVARVGDRLIDGSTRSRLVQLKRQLAGQTS